MTKSQRQASTKSTPVKTRGNTPPRRNRFHAQRSPPQAARQKPRQNPPTCRKSAPSLNRSRESETRDRIARRSRRQAATPRLRDRRNRRTTAWRPKKRISTERATTTDDSPRSQAIPRLDPSPRRPKDLNVYTQRRSRDPRKVREKAREDSYLTSLNARSQGRNRTQTASTRETTRPARRQ